MSGKRARPFLKWAGGKSQLLKFYSEYYAPSLKDGDTIYIEAFLGSGAVFFDVMGKYNVREARLYDINRDLVLCYRVVQSDINNLISFLSELSENYLRLDSEERKSFYYAVRSEYNRERAVMDYKRHSEQRVIRAGRMIFLNRTCYNGLYRLNKKGQFNTPAGAYENPVIVNKENLLNTSAFLQKAEINCLSFDAVSYPRNAFVYFDPPYRPLNRTSSFTSYYKHGFTDKEQKELAALYKKLDREGCYLMLSNSDPRNIRPDDDFFDDLYRGYHIHRIPARRMINSRAKKRGSVTELLICNYDRAD